MGRIETCPSREDGLPPSAPKDDSRQSDSDTEQQYVSSNVEELRTQLRKRDEQLVTLKDDKADCMKQILDMKLISCINW